VRPGKSCRDIPSSRRLAARSLGADRHWLCTSKGCVNLLSEVKAILYHDLGEAGERLRIYRRPYLQKPPTRTPLHEIGLRASYQPLALLDHHAHLTIVPFSPKRRGQTMILEKATDILIVLVPIAKAVPILGRRPVPARALAPALHSDVRANAHRGAPSWSRSRLRPVRPARPSSRWSQSRRSACVGITSRNSLNMLPLTHDHATASVMRERWRDSRARLAQDQ
jgi:hypothetical protein